MSQTKYLTKEEALKAANDGKNQSIKGKFIGQHVYCNVNSLVEYCLKHGYEDDESPVSFDSIENFYSYPEWSGSVLGEDLYFGGGSDNDKEEFKENFDRLADESQQLLDLESISEETHEHNLELIQDAQDDFEVETSEQEPAEIFEWWAVSSFLYRKLKEMGYCVVDAGSCYVYGRCTTGQAILLDYNISQICADMEILDGQQNSWA